MTGNTFSQSKNSQWKQFINKGLKAFHKKNIPRTRFYFRQACAHALLQQNWKGVATVFNQLLSKKITIPPYFFRYLRRAMVTGEKRNSQIVYRNLGKIWLRSKNIKEAIVYFRKGYLYCLKERLLSEAARLSHCLIKSGKRNEGIANLIHCARTAKVVLKFSPCFISAQLLAENSVPTAAIFWYNQAAYIAFKNKNHRALRKTIKALRLIGRIQDANWWKKKTIHDTKQK